MSGAGPAPERITDPDDPRIALYRAVRERDRIGREGVFIAEGATVLAVLLTRAALPVLSVLVEETRAPRLPVLAARGRAPLYLAPQPVLDAIAGFHLHRGILAAGRIPPPEPLGAALSADPLRLPVLVGLANHDNVGGIYRNAAAFNAPAVAIDATTADPFYRKAIRVGVGAPLIVPTVRMAPASAVAALRAAGVTVYALTPAGGTALGAAPLARRAAFLFGTEGPGLDPALIAAATPLTIPIAPGFDSLNVAATSAIALSAHAGRHGL